LGAADIDVYRLLTVCSMLPSKIQGRNNMTRLGRVYRVGPNRDI